ncbi:MAG: hypothetical protein LBB84_11445, partial [Tannerellaceae bacterium]|nr:hypothetical protein [Tannerellaceae bacterium]
NRITEIEKYHFSNKQKIDISQKIAFTNLKLTYLYEDKPDFYMALINDYLDIDYQQEPKLEIAIRGIKILIQMFEETNHLWDKSPQRIYFNKLLSHIQGKDTFNVSEGDDIKRQSFASFVLHKDNIENLETALISNLISEYRFAFGLWGVFYGFSNLPKTLTNNLFLSNDLDYISEVYKYIHKQVHNVELEGKLEKKQKECSNILEKEETKIRQNLRDKQIKDKQIEEIIEIWEKNDRMINEDLWSCILKIRGIGPKTMDKIKSCFLPNKQQTSNHHGYSQQNNRNKQPIQSLFQKESSNSFLTDLEFLLNNDEFIKIVSKHKDWENDLRWFIESHGKSHKDYETYWNDKSIDNESIIKQFISFKKGRYKDSENLLKRLYLQDEG